ncbi:unnamed protein product [Amoebophrya sp. A25]|nr:unnamed protein product [Amoebophrya sp. A25]|eukprot:GSA25T00003695001.1
MNTDNASRPDVPLQRLCGEDLRLRWVGGKSTTYYVEDADTGTKLSTELTNSSSLQQLQSCTGDYAKVNLTGFGNRDDVVLGPELGVGRGGGNGGQGGGFCSPTGAVQRDFSGVSSGLGGSSGAVVPISGDGNLTLQQLRRCLLPALSREAGRPVPTSVLQIVHAPGCMVDDDDCMSVDDDDFFDLKKLLEDEDEKKRALEEEAAAAAAAAAAPVAAEAEIAKTSSSSTTPAGNATSAASGGTAAVGIAPSTSASTTKPASNFFRITIPPEAEAALRSVPRPWVDQLLNARNFNDIPPTRLAFLESKGVRILREDPVRRITNLTLKRRVLQNLPVVVEDEQVVLHLFGQHEEQGSSHQASSSAFGATACWDLRKIDLLYDTEKDVVSLVRSEDPHAHDDEIEAEVDGLQGQDPQDADDVDIKMDGLVADETGTRQAGNSDRSSYMIRMGDLQLLIQHHANLDARNMVEKMKDLIETGGRLQLIGRKSYTVQEWAIAIYQADAEELNGSQWLQARKQKAKKNGEEEGHEGMDVDMLSQNHDPATTASPKSNADDSRIVRLPMPAGAKDVVTASASTSSTSAEAGASTASSSSQAPTRSTAPANDDSTTLGDHKAADDHGRFYSCNPNPKNLKGVYNGQNGLKNHPIYNANMNATYIKSLQNKNRKSDIPFQPSLLTMLLDMIFVVYQKYPAEPITEEWRETLDRHIVECQAAILLLLRNPLFEDLLDNYEQEAELDEMFRRQAEEEDGDRLGDQEITSIGTMAGTSSSKKKILGGFDLARVVATAPPGGSSQEESPLHELLRMCRLFCRPASHFPASQRFACLRHSMLGNSSQSRLVTGGASNDPLGQLGLPGWSSASGASSPTGSVSSSGRGERAESKDKMNARKDQTSAQMMRPSQPWVFAAFAEVLAHPRCRPAEMTNAFGQTPLYVAFEAYWEAQDDSSLASPPARASSPQNHRGGAGVSQTGIGIIGGVFSPPTRAGGGATSPTSSSPSADFKMWSSVATHGADVFLFMGSGGGLSSFTSPCIYNGADLFKALLSAHEIEFVKPKSLQPSPLGPGPAAGFPAMAQREVSRNYSMDSDNSMSVSVSHSQQHQGQGSTGTGSPSPTAGGAQQTTTSNLFLPTKAELRKAEYLSKRSFDIAICQFREALYCQLSSALESRDWQVLFRDLLESKTVSENLLLQVMLCPDETRGNNSLLQLILLSLSVESFTPHAWMSNTLAVAYNKKSSVENLATSYPSGMSSGMNIDSLNPSSSSPSSGGPNSAAASSGTTSRVAFLLGGSAGKDREDPHDDLDAELHVTRQVARVLSLRGFLFQASAPSSVAVNNENIKSPLFFFTKESAIAFLQMTAEDSRRGGLPVGVISAEEVQILKQAAFFAAFAMPISPNNSVSCLPVIQIQDEQEKEITNVPVGGQGQLQQVGGHQQAGAVSKEEIRKLAANMQIVPHARSAAAGSSSSPDMHNESSAVSSPALINAHLQIRPPTSTSRSVLLLKHRLLPVLAWTLRGWNLQKKDLLETASLLNKNARKETALHCLLQPKNFLFLQAIVADSGTSSTSTSMGASTLAGVGTSLGRMGHTFLSLFLPSQASAWLEPDISGLTPYSMLQQFLGERMP